MNSINHGQYRMCYTEGATIVTFPPSVEQLQCPFPGLSHKTAERVIQCDVPVGIVQCGVIAEASAQREAFRAHPLHGLKGITREEHRGVQDAIHGVGLGFEITYAFRHLQRFS